MCVSGKEESVQLSGQQNEGAAVRAMKRCYVHLLRQVSEKVVTVNFSEMLGPIYHITRITFRALSAMKTPNLLQSCAA